MLLSFSILPWRIFVVFSLLTFSLVEVRAAADSCQGIFQGEYLPAKDLELEDGAVLRLPVFVGSGHIAKTMILRNQQQLHKELSVLNVDLQIVEPRKVDPLFSRASSLKLVMSGKSKHLYRALRYLQNSQILKKEEFVEARERLLENQLSSAGAKNLKNYLALEKYDEKIHELITGIIFEEHFMTPFSLLIFVSVYFPESREEGVRQVGEAYFAGSYYGIKIEKETSGGRIRATGMHTLLYRFLKTLEFKDKISLSEYSAAMQELLKRVAEDVEIIPEDQNSKK
jgi:hypothetical protein